VGRIGQQHPAGQGLTVGGDYDKANRPQQVQQKLPGSLQLKTKDQARPPSCTGRLPIITGLA